MTTFSLSDLERIVAARASSGDSESWTAKLVAKGMPKAAQKLGEEAVETVIAAVATDRPGVVSESADLLYHWLVVLNLAGVPLSEVMEELERRTGQSGRAVGLRCDDYTQQRAIRRLTRSELRRFAFRQIAIELKVPVVLSGP